MDYCHCKKNEWAQYGRQQINLIWFKPAYLSVVHIPEDNGFTVTSYSTCCKGSFTESSYASNLVMILPGETCLIIASAVKRLHLNYIQFLSEEVPNQDFRFVFFTAQMCFFVLLYLCSKHNKLGISPQTSKALIIIWNLWFFFFLKSCEAWGLVLSLSLGRNLFFLP